MENLGLLAVLITVIAGVIGWLYRKMDAIQKRIAVIELLLLKDSSEKTVMFKAFTKD